MAHILLIGPIGVGKSTVAPVLGLRTGRPVISVDEVRFDYYRRAGYDDSVAARLTEAQDLAGLIAYWKPFEADAVEHLVEDHTDAVLDLGAGHADYPAGPLLNRVTAALAPHFVVLLMPDRSVETSFQFLRERVGDEQPAAVHELNRAFIASDSFRLLAKTIVYVRDRTPEDIADEIVERHAAALDRASGRHDDQAGRGDRI